MHINIYIHAYTGRAAARGPDAATRHMVTTKPLGHSQVDISHFGRPKNEKNRPATTSTALSQVNCSRPVAQHVFFEGSGVVGWKNTENPAWKNPSCGVAGRLIRNPRFPTLIRGKPHPALCPFWRMSAIEWAFISNLKPIQLLQPGPQHFYAVI